MPVIIERTFNASCNTVWQALTNRDQMQHWYFNLAEFKAEPGFTFEFEGTDGCETFLHHCQVTVADQAKKLTYSWRYKGYEGISYVTFELFPEGCQTRLQLTHAGLDTFPAGISSFARENFVAGWNEIIGTNLKNFVEKNTVLSQ